MKNSLISVVVPIYNVENYLEKCLDSLINQTYNNLEIILVNDCSTDNSGAIALEYSKKYNNVVYIENEKNSGLAFTRNAGMKIAKGEFIGFIDSDDYVDSSFYESLMNAIIRYNADIAVCDMKLIYEKENNREEISPCCNGEFNLLNVVNNGLVASACNKLFKKDIIKYEFAVGKVNEDIAVVIPALCDARRIAYAKCCYYNYIQRNNSIQNSSFSDKRFDIIEAVDTTLERIKKHYDFEELKESIIYNQIIVLFIYVIPKDARFLYRLKVLRKFNKLTKKYNVRNNKKYWSFIDTQSRKNKIYFKALFKCEYTGLFLAANLLISAYRLYSKFRRKYVIKTDADLNDLIKLAKIQKGYNTEKHSVSVVVPNYNYSRYMYQRFYSILSQNYKINEIIILDDCSKDDSREVIDKIVDELSPYINIKKEYNKVNSGTPFKQWKKGFELASSDYVWIAEADDYCEPTLLSNLMQPANKCDDVVISYADTAFVDANGRINIKSAIVLIDLMDTKHWKKSYINDGKNEIKNYSFLNCTIPNVSGCIIKKGDYTKFFNVSSEYRQAGDWLFYINVMSTGKVAYVNKVLNYYREHGNNVSATFKRQAHIDEIKKIHSYIEEKYGLDDFQRREINSRYEMLYDAWKVKRNEPENIEPDLILDNCYPDYLAANEKITQLVEDIKIPLEQKEDLLRSISEIDMLYKRLYNYSKLNRNVYNEEKNILLQNFIKIYDTYEENQKELLRYKKSVFIKIYDKCYFFLRKIYRKIKGR